MVIITKHKIVPIKIYGVFTVIFDIKFKTTHHITNVKISTLINSISKINIAAPTQSSFYLNSR